MAKPTFSEYIKSEDFKYGYEGHLTGWWNKEYEGRTKSYCEENLTFNHDNGLEFERAEEFIGRKLTGDEEIELTENFVIQVIERIEWEDVEDNENNNSDDFLIAKCWYDTCDSPQY